MQVTCENEFAETPPYAATIVTPALIAKIDELAAIVKQYGLDQVRADEWPGINDLMWPDCDDTEFSIRGERLCVLRTHAGADFFFTCYDKYGPTFETELIDVNDLKAAVAEGKETITFLLTEEDLADIELTETAV